MHAEFKGRYLIRERHLVETRRARGHRIKKSAPFLDRWYFNDSSNALDNTPNIPSPLHVKARCVVGDVLGQNVKSALIQLTAVIPCFGEWSRPYSPTLNRDLRSKRL